MSEVRQGEQDRAEISYPCSQPPTKYEAKRRYIRHVPRQVSFEEKEGLLNRFDALVRSGVKEQVVLERLGLTYDLVFQWRDELKLKRKLDEQFLENGPASNWFILKDSPSEQRHQQVQVEKQRQNERVAENIRKARSDKQRRKHEEIESKIATYHSLRDVGKSAHEAAAAVGVTYRQVRRWLTSGRFPGQEGKTRKSHTTEEKKNFLATYDELIRQGYRPSVAAQKVGVPSNYLYQWRKKLDLESGIPQKPQPAIISSGKAGNVRFAESIVR